MDETRLIFLLLPAAIFAAVWLSNRLYFSKHPEKGADQAVKKFLAYVKSRSAENPDETLQTLKQGTKLETSERVVADNGAVAMLFKGENVKIGPLTLIVTRLAYEKFAIAVFSKNQDGLAAYSFYLSRDLVKKEW